MVHESEKRCNACGYRELEQTDETAEVWPDSDTRRVLKCERCGVKTWGELVPS